MGKEYIRELYHLYESNMQTELETEEASEARRKIIKLTDELNEELTEQQQDKLQQLLELEHDRGALLDTEIFVYGYSLALKLFISGITNEK